MANITPPSQQQLVQALSNLLNQSGQSAIARQGAEVLVRQISGNQVTLNVTGLRENITLPRNQLQGNLASGQQYQARTSDTGSLLDFVLAKAGTQPNVIPTRLNSEQIATVLHALANHPQADLKSVLSVTAQVKAVQGNQVQLSVDVGGRQLQISVTLDSPATHIRPGQQVQVQLIPVADKWTARLTPQTSLPQARGSEKPSSPVITQISAQNAAKVVSAALAKSPHQEVNISLPKPELLLAKLAPQVSQKVNLAMAGQPLTTLQLTLDKGLQPRLGIVEGVKARITASADLSPLINAIKQQESGKTQPLGTTRPEQNIPGQRVTSDVKTTNANLAEVKELTKPVLSPDQRLAVQSILRRVLPAADSPSVSLANIEAALKDKSLSGDAVSTDVIKHIIKQVQQGQVQGQNSDAQSIRQLLAVPPLPLSPASISQAPPATGILGGLVTLIQLSLAARLSRQQPALSERISQSVLGGVTSGKGTTTSPAARLLQDVATLDNRHQLLKEVGKLLSAHQSNKLANIEQNLQSQESFYYVLPSSQGNKKQDVELLIRREKDKDAKKQQQADTPDAWHLTMKLPLGEVGELLTKARLKVHELDLDIYTSNEESKILVLNFLPLLKKRFSELGIEMTGSRCQLGRIPADLKPRAYQILETQA